MHKAYMAGLLDGEGCVGIYRHKGGRLGISVEIANTYKDVLSQLKAQWGGSFSGRTREGCQKIWRWGVSDKQAEMFLRHVRPFVQIKSNQLELALMFRETLQKGWRGNKLSPAVQAARQFLQACMRACNKKGSY